MTQFKSFRPSRIARDFLDDIEYGQRSHYINRAIEEFAAKHSEEVREELKKHDSTDASGDSGDKKSSSSRRQKPSDDQEATAENTSADSDQKTPNTEELIAALKNYVNKK